MVKRCTWTYNMIMFGPVIKVHLHTLSQYNFPIEVIFSDLYYSYLSKMEAVINVVSMSDVPEIIHKGTNEIKVYWHSSYDMNILNTLFVVPM